jgi:hypothetical protein
MLKFTNTLNIWIGTVGFINWWLPIDYYFVNMLFTGLYYWYQKFIIAIYCLLVWTDTVHKRFNQKWKARKQFLSLFKHNCIWQNETRMLLHHYLGRTIAGHTNLSFELIRSQENTKNHHLPPQTNTTSSEKINWERIFLLSLPIKKVF